MKLDSQRSPRLGDKPKYIKDYIVKDNNNTTGKVIRFTICNCMEIQDIECACGKAKKKVHPAELKSCFIERSKSEQNINKCSHNDARRTVSMSNLPTKIAESYPRTHHRYIRRRLTVTIPKRTLRNARFWHKLPLFYSSARSVHKVNPPNRRFSSKIQKKISSTLENIVEDTEESQIQGKIWLGVNPDNHVHGTGSNTPAHPQTPHIVYSPEPDIDKSQISDDDTEPTDVKESEENKDESTYKEENTSPKLEKGSQSPSTEPCGSDSPQYIDGRRNSFSDADRETPGQPVLRRFKFPSALELSKGTSSHTGNESPIVYPSDKEETIVNMDDIVQVESIRHSHMLKNEISRCPKCDTRSMPFLDPMEQITRRSRTHSMMDLMRNPNTQSNYFNGQSVHMQVAPSRGSLSTCGTESKDISTESLISCLSALYGKLLVVMGMAFPMAEVISKDVPLPFYYGFYMYLYCGSIIFIVFSYLFLLRLKSFPDIGIKSRLQTIKRSVSHLDLKVPEIPLRDNLKKLIPKKHEPEHKSEGLVRDNDGMSICPSTYKAPKYTISHNNPGSMYLKMGAVVFGVGSMIYSGLAFGQFFELTYDEECAHILMAITPAMKMLFTFLQMYFIFLNSRVAISKHTNIARFGLMHMVGTNLCIWLNVLVQETSHEISHLTKNHHSHEKQGLETDHHDDHALMPEPISLENTTHGVISKRSLGEMYDMSHCRKVNLMGDVVTSASPFLFPCTIEYSLLCAGVLYVMWKNTNVSRPEKNNVDQDSEISHFIARKVRHHYSVDCAKASRGLFLGIFLLVLTIISLILFYVLISNEEFRQVAILEANVIEVTIYSLSLISVIIGMKQMRELEFMPEGDIELDNILLLIAQAGVYIYASFTIIGALFSIEDSPILPLITAILTLAQTTSQTIFILDGSRRCCYSADQHERKPGREIVTFLLVCNLAMWAISTFETSRADVHPVQLEFYGIWAWTIISHVSMPLAIFYRFHATVCLGEIWKRSYKMKNDFMGY